MPGGAVDGYVSYVEIKVLEAGGLAGAVMEDICPQAYGWQEPGFKVSEAGVVGAAGHVEAEIGDFIYVYFPEESFGVSIGIGGGVEKFFLNWVQVVGVNHYGASIRATVGA